MKCASQGRLSTNAERKQTDQGAFGVKITRFFVKSPDHFGEKYDFGVNFDTSGEAFNEAIEANKGVETSETEQFSVEFFQNSEVARKAAFSLTLLREISRSHSARHFCR